MNIGLMNPCEASGKEEEKKEKKNEVDLRNSFDVMDAGGGLN